MPSLSPQFLQTASTILLWIGAGAGGVAAVAGLMSGVFANQASDSIRADADRRIAEAESQGKSAMARGNEAFARGEDAIARGAQAVADAAKANERAAKLENEAAKARLETERLKQLTSWRTIDSGRSNRATEYLAEEPASITVRYVANDPEALALAIQFSRTFSQARWDVRMLAVTYSNALASGLFIPEGGKATSRVRTAVRLTGIGFSVEPLPPPDMSLGDGREADSILFIGTKPQPQL